jgi:hypothetical protein
VLKHKDSQENSGAIHVAPKPALDPAIGRVVPAPKVDPLPPVTVNGRALWTDPRQ